MAVVTPQPTRRLFTPSRGLAEAVMRASPDPACMLAFWLVGLEEAAPEASGEICVAELFGHAIGPDRSLVDVPLDIDATDWHSYAAEWTPERIRPAAHPKTADVRAVRGWACTRAAEP